MPFLGGYVSSLEGKLLPTVFALDLFFPYSPFVFGISEAMESTDTQVRIPVSGELPGPLDYNSTLSR